jgi:hypothetical protein
MAHAKKRRPLMADGTVFHRGGPANLILTSVSRSVPFNIPRVCSSSFPYIATNFSTLPVSPPSSWMLATIPLLQNLNGRSPDGLIASRKLLLFGRARNADLERLPP